MDSIYLAGYAAECSLKAVILSRSPVSKRDGVLEEISSGSRGHNFDFLADILRQKNVEIPSPVTESLERVNKVWSTDLRYRGSQVHPRVAQTIIEAIRLIVDWAERSAI